MYCNEILNLVNEHPTEDDEFNLEVTSVLSEFFNLMKEGFIFCLTDEDLVPMCEHLKVDDCNDTFLNREIVQHIEKLKSSKFDTNLALLQMNRSTSFSRDVSIHRDILRRNQELSKESDKNNKGGLKDSKPGDNFLQYGLLAESLARRIYGGDDKEK